MLSRHLPGRTKGEENYVKTLEQSGQLAPSLRWSRPSHEHEAEALPLEPSRG
jgi:hypothetical protein